MRQPGSEAHLADRPQIHQAGVAVEVVAKRRERGTGLEASAFVARGKALRPAAGVNPASGAVIASRSTRCGAPEAGDEAQCSCECRVVGEPIAKQRRRRSVEAESIERVDELGCSLGDLGRMPRAIAAVETAVGEEFGIRAFRGFGGHGPASYRERCCGGHREAISGGGRTTPRLPLAPERRARHSSRPGRRTRGQCPASPRGAPRPIGPRVRGRSFRTARR